MAELRSNRRVQTQQGDQRTRPPAVACRSSVRSSSNFGARPAREAGGNAVGQVHAERCEARELTSDSLSSRILAHGLGLLRTRITRSWPQADTGVVLWSLSVCANDWQSAEKLT